MMIGEKVPNNQPIHLNEFEEEIDAACDNCRNQNTKFYYCKRWNWIKERYKKQHNKEMQSNHCPFWGYKPIGLWESVL